MKYKRVLFIRASLASAWVGAVSPPVGIAYLVEALGKHGCVCRTIDTALGFRPEELYAAIRAFSPDVIGISMLTYKYLDTYRMAGELKKHFPHIPLVVGGAHVSTMRENVLESCAAFDFGFVREAEESFVEFCQGTEPSLIKGVIYRDGVRVAYSGDRDYVNDLDRIDWPRDYGVDLDKYLSREILILSSRGCPHSCIFCPVSLAIGRKLRVRSPQNVVDEIEYWYRKGYRRFAILDDNFTFYKDRTLAICDEILLRKLDGISLRCGNGIRADRVDREMLEKMKSAGFTYVSYGVESGSDKVLQTLKKGETIAQIERAVDLSVELGFDVTLFFVVGAPGETLEDIEKSIEVSLRHPVMDVRFYNLIPYPGTELFQWIRDRNCFVSEPEEYLNDSSGFSECPVFETQELPVAQRIEVMKRLDGVTKTVRKNALRRKLQPFGPAGAIAVSMLGNLYVSNAFQAMIRQNRVVRRIIDNVYSSVRRKEMQ
ncbi:MAG: radical SAM protein [Geobacter sp.]|nr:radical SAM protein [Geobacter sp.]